MVIRFKSHWGSVKIFPIPQSYLVDKIIRFSILIKAAIRNLVAKANRRHRCENFIIYRVSNSKIKIRYLGVEIIINVKFHIKIWCHGSWGSFWNHVKLIFYFFLHNLIYNQTFFEISNILSTYESVWSYFIICWKFTVQRQNVGFHGFKISKF